MSRHGRYGSLADGRLGDGRLGDGSLGDGSTGDGSTGDGRWGDARRHGSLGWRGGNVLHNGKSNAEGVACRAVRMGTTVRRGCNGVRSVPQFGAREKIGTGIATKRKHGQASRVDRGRLVVTVLDRLDTATDGRVHVERWRGKAWYGSNGNDGAILEFHDATVRCRVDEIQRRDITRRRDVELAEVQEGQNVKAKELHVATAIMRMRLSKVVSLLLLLVGLVRCL
jgi:hypothetical protein